MVVTSIAGAVDVRHEGCVYWAGALGEGIGASEGVHGVWAEDGVVGLVSKAVVIFGAFSTYRRRRR